MKNQSLPVKPRMLLLFTLLCAAVASWQSVHANQRWFFVTNTNDSGPGSLRSRLEAANDGDTINFTAETRGTITLTSGQLEVTKSVAINGPGANLLAVNGNANGRVCAIGARTTATITVTISGLTFTNGRHLFGGAGISIFNSSVTLSNCTVSGNSANNDGGGIDINAGELTLTNCVVSNNSTTGGGGGGISVKRGVRGLSEGTTVTVNNSTVSGNSASWGGGIANDGANGVDHSFAHLVLNNSTISGNSATSIGGGIYSTGIHSTCHGCGATVSVSNSTISGNSAAGDGGGGIYNGGGHNDGRGGNTIPDREKQHNQRQFGQLGRWHIQRAAR